MGELTSYIISDNKKIYTRMLIPESDKLVPLVIFSHGLGANHQQEQTMQEELCKNGVAVLSFDFAGGSGFVEGKSEGSNKEMSVITEMQNLRDIIKYAFTFDMIDRKRLYLIGASQGGIVSMLVAREMKSLVSGIYLLYPALPLFEDGKQRYAQREKIAEETNLHGIMVGKKYFWDIHDMEIYDLIKDLEIKTHIFHGTKDKLVPMSYVEEAIDTLPHGNMTIVEDGGHGFDKHMQLGIADHILKDIHKI